MLDTLDEIRPFAFSYLGSWAFFLFATFVLLPLFYRHLVVRMLKGFPARVLGMLFTWGILWLAAFGDVYWIAWQAHELCKNESGTRVYRKAEVEGFYGSSDIEYWSKYGFSYLENKTSGKDAVARLYMANGKVAWDRVSEATSEYEYRYDFVAYKNHFGRFRSRISQRLTDETLGEQISFSIHPGYFDSRFFDFTGLTFRPPVCHGGGYLTSTASHADSEGFIKSVLKPVAKTSGGQP